MIILHPHNQRVAVIGLPGAGKTTLAHRYVQVSGLPHIELDVLYWQANWKQVHPAVFRQRISRGTQASKLAGGRQSDSDLQSHLCMD